ncbi:MAG: purine-nucleoside phosphorylase [Candidatus Cryptobacteroides sp.]
MEYRDIESISYYLGNIIGDFRPEVGVILGSGLGKFADKIESPTVVSYAELPGMPIATAIGHKGNFVFGTIAGKKVVAMQGRYHYYEGYGAQVVVLPIRVMIALGIKTLLVSNATGGVNFDLKVGDLMVIRDHINMIPNPLIGKNISELGPRFPDMTRPYDPELIRIAKLVAQENGIELKEGIYLACSGPTYETPAEYAFFRRIGADAVGMSITLEVIAARHAGIRVFGLSVITDEAHSTPDDYVTDENEILIAAEAASERMNVLFENIIARC